MPEFLRFFLRIKASKGHVPGVQASGTWRFDHVDVDPAGSD